jgi:hypothetical protein
LTYSGSTTEWLASNEELAEEQDRAPPDEVTRVFRPEDYEEDVAKVANEGKFDENLETTKRQKGDLGVWKYYGKSIGYMSLFVTLICICISTFGNNFQSKFGTNFIV